MYSSDNIMDMIYFSLNYLIFFLCILYVISIILSAIDDNYSYACSCIYYLMYIRSDSIATLAIFFIYSIYYSAF
jgi:hypothetical protein